MPYESQTITPTSSSQNFQELRALRLSRIEAWGAKLFADRFRRRPRLTLSQWADEHRRLSPEASAEPGRWRTSRAEYQRGIFDAISDPGVGTVVCQTSAQVGKTEALLNAIGYYIHQDPSPILLVQPNVEPMAEAFSKERLAPMVRDTQVLSGLVADAKAKFSGNTILHKEFPGGHVTMAGANSAASLASRPIRILMCDEIDKYPPSVGGFGDPIALATARTKTFGPRRKVILTSTPTLKGFSRIEQAYEESDKRRFWVPCPDCGEHQVLAWRNVKYTDPKNAAYACEHCGSLWDDGKRWSAVSRGKWVAENEFRGVAGFHLSELYSPWVRLHEMATAYETASKSRSAERMQQFHNESLGETWEFVGETVQDDELKKRGETWDGIPKGVLVRTVGIDVQPDRLEIEYVGWGDWEESWSLDYRVIFGDPQGQALWKDLERYLDEQKPHAVCIDSGGHNTQAVYAWAAGKLRRRIYAIKGMAGPDRPVWPQKATTIKKIKGGRLFVIGVDAAKDAIYSRLRLTSQGAGYCHFPKGRDDDYYAGLTAETVRTRFSKGFPIREWFKKNANARNEPLDCRVYAYAALCSLSVNWARLRAKFERRSTEKVEEIPAKVEETPKSISQPRPKMPRQRWATNW